MMKPCVYFKEKIKILYKIIKTIRLHNSNLIKKCYSPIFHFCIKAFAQGTTSLSSGANEAEKKYFDFNARTLITLWGNINKDNILFDYAWREWNGLVGEFYRAYLQQAVKHNCFYLLMNSGYIVRTTIALKYFIAKFSFKYIRCLPYKKI